MTKLLLATALCLAFFPVFAAEPKKAGDTGDWDRSVVAIEVTRKHYDYHQPWSKRTRSGRKTGIVLGEKEILTTADEVFDRTLVRLQKGGRGKWRIGEVTWIDYHANLAIVTTQDESFWQDLKPAAIQGGTPSDAPLQIVRWREGNLETRKAEFSQFTVKEADLSPVNHVQIEVGTELQGAGTGEPLVANSHVAGLITKQDGRTCTVTPASFILTMLDARKKGAYRGLGYFDFYWQPAENPASLAHLQLEGEPRGVVVIDVPRKPGAPAPALKEHDIILEIAGFPIDTDGDYTDPEFGHLMLENLATRQKQAGDSVRMKIWRDGKPLEIDYQLPKVEYSSALVPDATFDQEPEFMIVGGLVFQPLDDPFLQSWGPEWKRRSPFRLYYYNNQPATAERPALVLLSQVLPDVYNLGYQDLKYLVLDTVNGRRISRLPDLREALKTPVNGFHVIQFVQTDAYRRIVVEAGAAETQATQRVLRQYRIPRELYIASETQASSGTRKP